MIRSTAAVMFCVILLFSASVHAVVHMFNFDIFTNNGMYNDDPGQTSISCFQMKGDFQSSSSIMKALSTV